MFAIKAADPGRVVSPVIQPGFDVADSYHPEDRLSRGERTFGWGFQMFSNAVSFGWYTLLNPANSGKIVVLRRLTISMAIPTAAVQPGVVVFTLNGPRDSSGEATVAKFTYTDGRASLVAQQSTAGYNLNQTRNVVGAINSENILNIWGFEFQPGAAIVPNFVIQSPDLDVVLPPGSALRFGPIGTVLATAPWGYTSYVQGYERVADPNELITPPP